MKKVVAFTIADENNLKYAQMLQNSLKHTNPDIHLEIVQGDKLKAHLEADPMFFYRATPIIAEQLLKEYELVIKIDADSIVTGSLDYVINTKDYDVGTVINWNRVDPQKYGTVSGWGISPIEYMNCGFVAMRSAEFVKQWKKLCFSPQFDNMQYKEQDLLNALIYFGNFNVRCFDHGDGIANEMAWYGLISKGEWMRTEMKDGKMIVPKSSDNFPQVDTEIRVIHWAGGSNESKMEYRTRFPETVVEYLNKITSV